MTASAIPTGTDSAAGMRCKAQTRLAPHGRAWGTPRRQGQALRALRGLDGIGAAAGLRPLAARPCSLHRAHAWAKLASTQRTSNPGRAAFVSTSPARTTSSETCFLYDGGASGQTIYGYVEGNPVSKTDPEGLEADNQDGGGDDDGGQPSKCSCFINCLMSNLGMTVTGGAMVGSGSPVIPKSFQTPGATGYTSVLSSTLGSKGRMSRPLPAPTYKNWGAKTPYFGRFCARWIPIIGWGVLAYDSYSVMKCTLQCQDGGVCK